jgi:RHS repeat-associated protein
MHLNYLVVASYFNRLAIRPSQRTAYSILARAIFAGFCVLLMPAVLLAQNNQYTKSTPDQTMRGDARIDPASHALSIQIPLAAYPGRAGVSLPISITYSPKFRHLELDGDFQPYDARPYDLYYLYVDTNDERSTAGWTSSLAPPRIEGGAEGYDGYFNVNVGQPGGTYPYIQSISRIRILLGDGSSHELRRDDTPRISSQSQNSGPYYSVDGSQMRFEGPGDSGTLFMADGSRYLFAASQATQYIDRNGNTLNYNNTLKQWTDTLGRTLAGPFTWPYGGPTAGNQQYTLTGLNGNPLVYTFRWRNLRDPQTNETVLSDPNQELYYPGDRDCTYFQFSPDHFPTVSPSLFTSNNGRNPICAHDRYNPVVLSELVLPNGKSYRFTYNVYGEIDKMYLPTGGYERYQYDKIAPMSFMKAPFGATNRGVTDRWVSSDGASAGEAHWQYGVEFTPYSGSLYATTMTSPDGTLTRAYLHAQPDPYDGSVVHSIPYGFDDARSGRAYDERIYDSVGTMLHRSLTEWTVSGPTAGGYSGATRNARVTKRVDILLDTGTGAALATTTTMEYDVDLNLIATNHYDYAVVDQTTAQSGALSAMPSGTLIRTEETTYLVNDSSIAPATRDAYRSRNLIGLPTSMRVKNGAGTIVAQSAINYDEMVFPLLTYGSVTSWADPATSVRGNPTTVSRWQNTTGTWLQTHTQFDQCGSLRAGWDAKGNQSQIEYSSTYAYAYPTLTLTPVPDPSGQFGSSVALSSSTVFDFNTGSATSGTDANNISTTLEYNDPLNRPTRTVQAAGNSAQSQSPVSYDDTNRKVTGQTDLNNFNDNALKSESLYDGLGRTFEVRTYEGGTNYIAVQTQYDALGRAFKVSQPFRPWQNETPLWTTSAFDALGRVISVTTPDGAQVTTAYAGNTVTVTDQAGKKRRSVIDGLGRLVRVDEPDKDTGNLDVNGVPVQSTSYSYDALGNLLSVNQGEQTRTFVYDSLGRLLSATNPESGAICYGRMSSGQCQPDGYDNNGNLIYKTDARGVVSTYAYDALNRNLTVTYANDPANTPTVTRTYDGATNGKGKLWKTETSGDTASRTTIDGFDALGRPTSQSQQFYWNNAWSQPYTVSATYDKAGHVLTQTYPSLHTTSYGYDGAGRTTSFAGNLGDDTDRSYSSGMIYSPFGSMTKEQFGTNTAVFNKLFYNVRGQLAEIRESTSYTGATDTSGDRGAIINHYSNQAGCGGASCNATDNNGNLRRQEVYIPRPDSTDWDKFAQFYEYDALNRLQSVRENENGGAVQWQQRYVYDRYGNRTIDQDVSRTYGAGINKKNLTVNTANNRLGVPAGQSVTMTYDPAGNLSNDTYTGGGSRTYDAENRMISATGDDGLSTYTYDGDGHRVRRYMAGEETDTWQIYGLTGELLAEYKGADNDPSSPQKEYGYRNGQLLITVEPPLRGVWCDHCVGGGSSQGHGVVILWLVTDQLGTPRMIFDQSGALANVKRHDYLPFGEELFAGTGGRTTTQGYSATDGVRQKFTQKERDVETGLDYFLARYYSSTQGRFTGVDPYDINLERQNKPDPKEAEYLFREYISNPQQWNHYTYALNNPLAYLDPTGEAAELVGTEEERKKQLEALKAVVGKQAGAYLYENKITDKDGNTRYFVGIYTNGPDGKGPAFEKINEAAGEVAAIIRDAPIQRLGVVSSGTVLKDDYGNVRTIGSIDQKLSPGLTSEYGGVTTSYILDPSTNPGKLPGSYMSDGQPSQPTTGELMGHEIGHGRARVTRDPNSNAAALRLENKVRTKVENKTATRIRH